VAGERITRHPRHVELAGASQFWQQAVLDVHHAGGAHCLVLDQDIAPPLVSVVDHPAVHAAVFHHEAGVVSADGIEGIVAALGGVAAEPGRGFAHVDEADAVGRSLPPPADAVEWRGGIGVAAADNSVKQMNIRRRVRRHIVLWR
jgi:hypothetical protein